jgi:Ca-activated chloride channel family protein
MPEFHFLRPLWLIALPLGLWLIWQLLGRSGARGNWPAVVDPGLQPFVLAEADAYGARLWPLLAAITVWSVATLSLAGPTWERLPVPAFRSDEALVVALDLSRSMDAADIEPSRLARARLKLLGLLEFRAGGQTALVVFSAHAFTVTPLTTDTRTIASLVNALNTDIMPSRGSYPEAGLQRAGLLLEQAGMTRGEILVMTDADVSPRSLDLARQLRRDGYTVNVLAVGTAEGAPIPESGGGFLTDRAGNVVVPQLDVAALRRLAEAGGGRFAQLTADDRDLEALFPARGAVVDASLAAEEQSYEADVWRDQGVWLAVLLLPLLALGFRRGWVAAWLVCFLLPAPRASAFEWRDLWVRPDQQGYEAMQAQRPDAAAELFKDPQWLAAAEYRTGDYSGSVATLSSLDTVEANYNRGNALARAGQLEQAIQAYDRAIEFDPQHEDAIYNRALVEELLEQQQQNQDQQNEQSGSDDQEQNSENSADSGEQQEDGESDSEERDGDSGDESQRNAQQRGGEGDQEDDSQDPEQGDEEQQADNEPEEGEGDAEEQNEQQLAASGPEDVEQWASDQAAEQWLRRIPQDPGGLLRRKFLYQYQRLGVDQDGNYVWPGDEAAPW